jgi:hypothetical protein
MSHAHSVLENKATRAKVYPRGRAPTTIHTRTHTRACTDPRAHTHAEICNTLLFHGNDGLINARQCCVTRTLPLLLHCFPTLTVLLTDEVLLCIERKKIKVRSIQITVCSSTDKASVGSSGIYKMDADILTQNT